MKALNVRNMRNTRQSGFTIIELVVVILLLGILTATALPRFMDVTTEAHDAVVDATVGGFGTGLALYRAQWVAGGQQTSAVPEFGNLMPSPEGYPVGLTGGAGNNEVDLQDECEDVLELILQSAGQVTSSNASDNGTETAGTVSGALDATNFTEATAAGADFHAIYSATDTCTYIYAADAARVTLGAGIGFSYNVATGVVTQSATL